MENGHCLRGAQSQWQNFCHQDFGLYVVRGDFGMWWPPDGWMSCGSWNWTFTWIRPFFYSLWQPIVPGTPWHIVGAEWYLLKGKMQVGVWDIHWKSQKCLDDRKMSLSASVFRRSQGSFCPWALLFSFLFLPLVTSTSAPLFPHLSGTNTWRTTMASWEINKPEPYFPLLSVLRQYFLCQILCYPPYSRTLKFAFFFSFFFFCLLGLHQWHMEVPRLGVELEL